MVSGLAETEDSKSGWSHKGIGTGGRRMKLREQQAQDPTHIPQGGGHFPTDVSLVPPCPGTSSLSSLALSQEAPEGDSPTLLQQEVMVPTAVWVHRRLEAVIRIGPGNPV